MQIVSVIPYNVNRRKHPKTHPLFLSGASNIRSLQATDLKFAEYIDIYRADYLCKIQE